MLSADWKPGNLCRNIISRFGRARGKPSPSAPLVDRAELIALQKLAYDHAWANTSMREIAHRMSGSERSVYIGAGMDYEESRPYQPGDDLRFMNWRLTARTGESYMKVFREEKRPATFILVDKRSRMRFGSRTRLKVTQAVRVAAYLAFSSLKQRCAVAGVVLDSPPQWFDACSDEAGIYHFLNEAASNCKPAYMEAGAGYTVTFDYMLKLLQKMMTAGSDIFLVSDFAGMTGASRAALLQMAQQCNVTAIHIFDQAEINLPVAGKLCFHDRPGGRGVVVDTDSEQLRREVHENALVESVKVKQLFESLGCRYIRVRTDSRDIVKDILHAGSLL